MPDSAPKSRRAQLKDAVDAVENVAAESIRDWKALVEEIRGLREKEVTVPEIAELLKLPYVLVNQVMLQSYKMTVDTVRHFEAWEKRRMAPEPQE